MESPKHEVFVEWQRPALDGFATKKWLRAIAIVLLASLGGSAAGYYAWWRRQDEHMLLWVLVGAGVAAVVGLIVAVPKTLREVALATRGVPVAGTIVGEEKSSVDGSSIPVIAYTANGTEYQRSFSVNQELFSKHVREYGVPILLVDADNPNRAQIVIEVFRLD